MASAGATPSLASQLIISLIDRVTGPAQGVSAAVKGMTDKIGSSTRGAADSTNALTSSINSQIGSFKAWTIKVAAAGAALYALYATIKSAAGSSANFETVMVDLALKTGQTVEQTAGLGKQIRALSSDVNQTSGDIANAIINLMDFGLSADQSLKSAAAIGQAATAYGVAMTDLSKVAVVAINQLKVPADEIGRVLDIMAQSAVDGGFEINNMASAMPGLMVSMSKLGARGTDSIAQIASALQQMTKMLGSSEAAAAGLGSMLDAVTSKKGRKRMETLGLDPDVMAKAIKKGLDPVDALIVHIERFLNGDLTKLSQIFPSREAQGAFTALLRTMPEYREKVDSALQSQGRVLDDFQTRMRSFNEMTKQVGIQIDDIKMSIGDALLPGLKDVLIWVKPVIETFRDWAAANPELIRTIYGVIAAVTALKVAFLILPATLALSPLLIPLAALAAAVKFFVDNKEGITAFFEGFSTALKDNLGGDAAEALKPLMAAIDWIANALKTGSWTLPLSPAEWEAMGTSAGSAAAGGIREVLDAVVEIGNAIRDARAAWDSWFGKAQDPLAVSVNKATGTAPETERRDATRYGRGRARRDEWLTDIKSWIDQRSAIAMAGHAKMLSDIDQYINDQNQIMMAGYDKNITDMKAWLANLPAAMATGFESMLSEAATYLSLQEKAFIAAFASITAGVRTAMTLLGENIKAGFVSVFDYLIERIRALPALIASAIKDIASFGTPTPKLPSLPPTAQPSSTSIIGKGIDKGIQGIKSLFGVDTGEIDAAKTKAEEARQALATLDGTVRPKIDPRELTELLGLIDRADAALSRLGTRARAGITSASDYINSIVSGNVDQARRSENSDYEVQ